MATLNLDISAKIDIQLLASHSMDVEVLWYQDAARQQPMAVVGTLKLIARHQVTGEVVELPEGDGISKEDNAIRISRRVADNVFTKGTWLYELRGDLEDGTSIPYMSGKIISNG